MVEYKIQHIIFGVIYNEKDEKTGLMVYTVRNGVRRRINKVYFESLKRSLLNKNENNNDNLFGIRYLKFDTYKNEFNIDGQSWDRYEKYTEQEADLLVHGNKVQKPGVVVIITKDKERRQARIFNLFTLQEHVLSYDVLIQSKVKMSNAKIVDNTISLIVGRDEFDEQEFNIANNNKKHEIKKVTRKTQANKAELDISNFKELDDWGIEKLKVGDYIKKLNKGLNVSISTLASNLVFNLMSTYNRCDNLFNKKDLDMIEIKSGLNIIRAYEEKNMALRFLCTNTKLSIGSPKLIEENRENYPVEVIVVVIISNRIVFVGYVGIVNLVSLMGAGKKIINGAGRILDEIPKTMKISSIKEIRHKIEHEAFVIEHMDIDKCCTANEKGELICLKHSDVVGLSLNKRYAAKLSVENYNKGRLRLDIDSFNKINEWVTQENLKEKKYCNFIK